LHRGTPTDRFVAEWRIREPHVERRIFGSGSLVRDSSVSAAPIVNPSQDGQEWIRPVEGKLTLGDRRVLVEIPMGFGDMQQRDPDLALDWRLTTRRIFQTYLHRGYRVVDFFLSRENRRGHYLMVEK
jgi:predicted GNAT superfamily acetyltransferase